MQKIKSMLAVTVVLLVFIFTNQVLAGQVITVDDDGPADYPIIQDAINAAADGDTVLVADGIYIGQGNRVIDFLGKAITVQSKNGPEVTIVNCENAARGFYFHSAEDATSALVGFTIKNGASDDEYGAGIRCNGSSPVIENCIISDNNKVAIGIFYDSNPIINNCVIKNNNGGILGGYSNPVISNCVITENYGIIGGMYLHSYSHLTVDNCLVTNNSCISNGGGGIACGWEASFEITNCTIANNTSASEAGGIIYTGSGTITNCIIWANSYPQIYNRSSDPSEILDITYCNIQDGWPGEGNIDTVPLFVSGPLGDYYLSQTTAGQGSNSPCVDTGSDLASALGMDVLTTSTTAMPDTGIVDMGYHYLPLLPIEADIAIEPKTLNLSGKGKWITCYISLPADYDIADVNIGTISLAGDIPAVQVWVNEQQQFIMTKFSRPALQEILEAGEVELTLSGELTDRTKFEGKDTITVIDKASKVK